jgi:hypothetical protein
MSAIIASIMRTLQDFRGTSSFSVLALAVPTGGVPTYTALGLLDLTQLIKELLFGHFASFELLYQGDNAVTTAVSPSGTTSAISNHLLL